MAWCEYCVDRSSFFFTDYKCIRKDKDTEEEIPEGYVKWYCGDENTAYAKCPIYNGWYITTATSNIIGRGGETLVIKDILDLKDNEFKKSKYKLFMELYKIVGPIISCRLLNSLDSDERASKIYSKFETISELIKNNNNSTAATRYIMMTLRLVIEYSLQDLYRSKRDNIKKTLDLK